MQMEICDPPGINNTATVDRKKRSIVVSARHFKAEANIMFSYVSSFKDTSVQLWMVPNALEHIKHYVC